MPVKAIFMVFPDKIMKKKNLKRNVSFRSRMILWQPLTILLLYLFSASALAEELPPIDNVVARVQKLYDNTQTLSAGFVQETTVTSVRKTDTEKGKVYFKSPRRMLWDYSSPTSKKLVITAEIAWLYLPDEKVAYRQNSERLFQSAALIKFLSGIGKLTEDFSISFASPTPTDAEGNFILKLEPKETGAAYQFLQLTVHRKTFHIVRVSFEDVLGNTTVLKFYDVRLNAKISKTLFEFKPPADVSIFEMP